MGTAKCPCLNGCQLPVESVCERLGERKHQSLMRTLVQLYECSVAAGWRGFNGVVHLRLLSGKYKCANTCLYRIRYFTNGSTIAHVFSFEQIESMLQTAPGLPIEVHLNTFHVPCRLLSPSTRRLPSSFSVGRVVSPVDLPSIVHGVRSRWEMRESKPVDDEIEQRFHQGQIPDTQSDGACYQEDF